MFKKILIANRGEIACRVMLTAKRLGIQTVAVYSEADAEARHVRIADEAVCIGPPPSRESYLRMDRIIAACKETGAQAVHPGYGFLSENEEFAKRVEEEGIIFIGPKYQSIAAMGDKIASKKLALEAKVNTIPGHNAAIDDPQAAVKIAQGIGYPVMIKASAGGGGKGLRVAYNDQETAEGFVACKNEALNSFGDDRVFIEKFVEEPRHIEIQVLGDAHGNVVYLWERECSIPMECRINAEDPLRNFLPSTGRLVKYQPPASNDGVRVDTGVYEGGEIPMYYDSMIAKLITHGANRDEAMSKMRGALNEFVIRGIHSNIQFQSALLQHPRFLSGQFNTGFIAEEFPKGFLKESVLPTDPNRLPALASFVHRRYLERAKLLEGQLLGHEMKITQEFVVMHGETSYNTKIEQRDHGYQISVKANQGKHAMTDYFLESDWQPGSIRLAYRLNDGPMACAQVERPGLGYVLMQDGVHFDCVVLSPFGAELQRRMPYKAPPDTSKLLLSPMPGLLTKLHVAKGDKVTAGQKLVVIEAMKMENTLFAAQDGIVADICASEGSSLAVDQIIIQFAK
ncbi:MAG: acetyl/propionyl-CoA carboxylase subunit alpha [Burkholderiaceae bacterium]|nr:acetyl/propionyl-CoA carboxylase subunit alpha [Burkholderiaceae bacterium]